MLSSAIRRFIPILILTLTAPAVFAVPSTHAQDIGGQPQLEVVPNISDNTTALALSASGRRLLASGLGNSVKLWDLPAGRLMRTFLRHSQKISSIMFLSDGKEILSASEDLTIKLWDAATGQLLRTTELVSPADYLYDLKLSPDGKRALSAQTVGQPVAGTYRGVIKLWDTATGQLLRSFRVPSAAYVAFSPDGIHFVSGDWSGLKLWDLATGRLLRTFVAGYGGASKYFDFSRDGSRLLANSEKTVKLWDVVSGRLLRSFEHTNYLTAIALSRDGTRAATADHDGAIRFLDMSTGQLLHNLKGGFKIELQQPIICDDNPGLSVGRQG